MDSNAILQRDDIMEFVTRLYDGDLHAKRVLSLANATLGVITSASLAIHAVGQGLAQALGKLAKHGVKQVDRLLSNEGMVIEEFFTHWVPYMVGAVGGCVKPRINGEQWSPLPAITGAGDDSERRVGV